MITNFVVVGLVYRLAVNRHYIKHWLVDLMMKKKKKEKKKKAKQNRKKKKEMPRVRIELTTFRSLCFSDYETDALPTALSRHGHVVGIMCLCS